MTDPGLEARYRAYLAVLDERRLDDLVDFVAGDRVACRLVFDCTPRSEFLGFTPNGRRLVFAEHVFYRFRDGRITEVSSLIDRPAIERQLREPDAG